MKEQGAIANVKSRFDKTETTAFWEEEWLGEEPSKQKTILRPVYPKTIVNPVKSFDLPFVWSLNPYQGCEHGCSYCYARPTHEYWSLNSGVDFERHLLYKPNAPELLEKHFQKKNLVVSPISISGNTDAYQPIEKDLKITRNLLGVFLKYKHPVTIITKNALILRDLDILTALNKARLIGVAISIITLNEDLRRRLEPRTSTAANRLKAIRILNENEIPVFGMMAPLIPSLNSHEIFDMAKALHENGAQGMGYSVVRLNDAVEPIFIHWVNQHYPDRAEKILNQIRSLHEGNLGNRKFKERMRGSGHLAESIKQTAQLARAKFFPDFKYPELNTKDFCPPGQLKLFP